MTHEREPTEDELQAVFKHLHAAGWPDDLRELRLAAARLTLVNRIARNVANGGSLGPRLDLTGPITNPQPAQPMAHPQARGPWPFPAKRSPGHAMQGIDRKRAAAGDVDDVDDL